MTTELVDYMGSDGSVLQAMLVSTQGSDALKQESDNSFGRINFLMKNRHGTPFEHNSMTFYIEAPIFVFREFHLHRIGWSYNEMSGRYKELEPVFYAPALARPLIQVGKPGHYTFEAGSQVQSHAAFNELADSYQQSYVAYQSILGHGIAKEVARACLPVGIYSSMFATCNARSLMAFLSLRTKEEGSTFPSYPQYEIEQVARDMEEVFRKKFPLTYKAFVENGRVAP
jgi:thymidylate synthase (FAD)